MVHSADPAFPGLRPVPLGGRIAVVAPGYGLDEASIETGAVALRELGFEVRIDPRCRLRHGKLAGADVDRAAALMEAFTDSHVDAIMALRGGYGCTRLLGRLDYARIAACAKPLIGFSDVTALLAACGPVLGANAIHGPSLESLARGLEPRDLLALQALLQGDVAAYRELLAAAAGCCRIIRGGRALAPLAGGNLSLLAGLCGTPWSVPNHGRLLFLEDWNEPLYRIDRLLTQLEMAGRLDGIAGLVLGECRNITRIGEDLPGTLEDCVLRHLPADVPVVTGFPAGHGNGRFPLPLGMRFWLDEQGLGLHDAGTTG